MLKSKKSKKLIDANLKKQIQIKIIYNYLLLLLLL